MAAGMPRVSQGCHAVEWGPSRERGALTSTGMMLTVYMGGLMAANHSFLLASSVASVDSCPLNPFSIGTVEAINKIMTCTLAFR